MVDVQKYKVVNDNDDHPVFFVDRAFDSAHKQAMEYVERNKGKFPMTVYRRTLKPKPSPLWEEVSNE